MIYVKTLDILSEPIQLSFDSHHVKKTVIGGLLTICTFIFTIYCIFYFGIDIIQKKKPTTKFSKQFVNESATYLTDFPFTFYITNIMTDRITDVDKYITFLVRYYESGVDETGSFVSAQHQLFVERCDQKHFAMFPKIYKDNLPLGDEIYCLNPFKIKYSNGTTHENHTYLNIKNDMTATPSNIVRFEIYECDPIRDKKECHPPEKRKQLLEEFYIILYLLDYYIDSSDYHEPNKPFVQTLPQPLSIGTTKETLFKVKTTEIITDSGFLLDETSERYINQIEEYYKDTQINGSSLYALGFGNTRIRDVYYRQYLKIQDLIAQIGGLIKFLILVGNIICRYYSNITFASHLSNLIFVKLEETPSNFYQSELQLKSANKLTINRLNNYTKKTSFNSTPLNTCFYDYMLAKCNRKSKYNKKLYENIRNFMKYHFNILYIIKQLVKIDRLIEILNKKPEFKACLEQKLIYDSFNFQSISTSFEDSNNLRESYSIIQNRLSLLTS